MEDVIIITEPEKICAECADPLPIGTAVTLDLVDDLTGICMLVCPTCAMLDAIEES